MRPILSWAICISFGKNHAIFIQGIDGIKIELSAVIKSLKKKERIGVSIKNIYKNEIGDDKYKNPVDGKTYQADEWKTYEPQKQKTGNESRLENLGLRLLSSQKEFEANVEASTLSTYIKAIESRIIKIVESYPNSGELLVQVELSNKKNPEYKKILE